MQDPHMRIAQLLPTVAALLAGCASKGTYRELVRDFETHERTPYYVNETAEPIDDVMALPEATTDPVVADVQRRIIETKQRWETALQTDSRVPVDVASDEPGYGQLAHDPTLGDRLAEAAPLDLLLGLIPELNPAVQAARRSLQATLEQYPQALYLDTILKQYNAFTKQLNTSIGTPNHKGMNDMTFPFPDALALKGKLVDEEVELAQRQREIALRDAETAMRTAYHSHTFIDAAISINRENEDLLGQIIKVAQARMRVDKANYQAVIMAQVELSKLRDAIITLEERRGTVVAKINTLLARQPDAALGSLHPGPDVELAAELDDVYDIAIRDRQELQQQQLRIAKMATMVELASRMTYPDPTTGSSYFEDRMRLSSGTGQAPPPFMTRRDLNHRETPWFGQRDAYIREIRTRVTVMDTMLASMQDKTRFEVKQAHVALDTAKRSVALYRESLLPQARQALGAANTGYSAGKTDFLTFLDAQRTLLTFQLAEESSLRDYRIEFARIEQLAGHPLPHRPLRLSGSVED